MNTEMSSLKQLWRVSCGPLLTGATVLVLHLMDRYFLAIPNPPAILLLSLVFSAYVGGFLSGMISATFAGLYISVFFSISGRPFHYTDENLRRVIVWWIALPATALMVGTLKSRTMHQLSALRESEIRLRSVINHMVDAVFTFDERSVIKSFNPAAELLFGYAEQEVTGQDVATLLVASSEPTGASAPGEGASDNSQEKRLPLGLSRLPANRREMLGRYRDGTEFPVEVSVAEMAFGQQVIFIGTTRDIRERKRAEEERRLAEEERSRFHEELIRAQANALLELSTPLIPIRSKMLVMPLVGSVDSQRAVRVVEVLLKGISEHRAHSAILDITGVPVVDTQVASALVRAANAARMLGAQVVLTGIRPEVATALVSSGAELRGVVTFSTLEQGIAFAEDKQRQPQGARDQRSASSFAREAPPRLLKVQGRTR